MARSSVSQPAAHLRSFALVVAALLALLPCADSISYVTYGPGIVNDAGYSALYALYNRSYVAFQPSLPSVSIGLSVSLGTDVRLSGLDTALQYAVELLNFRGGVVVRGVQQYVSVTYAVDGSSSSEAAAIYGAMLQWGNITAFLAPSSDALLQAASTKLAGAALTLAVDDRDPASYGSGEAASYLFSQLNTATSTWTAALHSINAQAQTYAAAGGSASANGIKTLCMFSTADSLTQAAAAGVRAWIAAENARRGNTDNITVYADRVWYCNATGTYKDYVPFLSACPDAVDVMLLQDANVDELAVAAALTDSQLRPRAVLGINPNNVQLSKTPTAAQGWTLALSTASRGSNSTLGRYGGKFTSYTDAGTGLHYWCAGAGLSAAVPVESYLYFAAFDVLLAAFNQSASLTSAADLAAGLLSLNGSSSILGPLAFDPVTGINVAAQMYTAQVLANGSPLLITPSTNLTYPWPWPHALTKPDPIDYITYGPGVVSPMGVAYLLADHNASYVPRNASSPTINIGLSLSLGQNSLLTNMDIVLQFIVDLVNFRGGMTINGERHYLSITYATDGASDELTQYIYEDMYLSGQYALYLAPVGDGLVQSLSSFLASTQSLVYSVYNVDPTDFSTAHTNLVSLVDTADARWGGSLDVINRYAQLYAKSSGTGSVNGIKTFCMFSTTDTIVQAAAEGVRQWIAAENERRGNNDNITVYVDGIWAANLTGSYLDYVPYLSACPDGVDLMLLQDGSTTTLNGQQALAASQLRPKAALGLDPSNAIAAKKGVESIAAGWVYPLPAEGGLASTLPALGGKWFNVIDIITSLDVWAAGANVSSNVPELALGYVAVVDIIAAVLNQTASLSATDLRAALQSLNGQDALIVPLDVSNTTGVNVALASTVEQILSDGSYAFIANQTGSFPGGVALKYPYDWAWPGLIHAGDTLDSSQSSGLAILGVVICVLGAWVAQIIVEQSIFVRRKGGWYQLWLFVVALALGGVGIWCAVLMSASALTVSKPNNGGSLSMSFSFEIAMLTWLPAILLTWCGLMVLMADVETNTVTGASRASQAQQTLREQKEAKKKRAALSNRAHFFHLVQAISWRSLVGGVLVAAAIGITRSVMWYIWVQDASFRSAGWAWAVTTLINVVGVPLAMLMYFHALRWRIAAVFLFAICVMVDYQVQLAGLTFYYEPGAKSLPSSLLSADIDATIVNLIAGIIAAFICFIFIGLQFSRMRLSRNGLSVLVASLESLINKQKDQLRTEADINSQLRSQLTAALRLVEHINIVSPIPTEYAFAMASSAQLETFQALYAMPLAGVGAMAGRASHATSMMTGGRSGHGSANGVGERGKMLGAARVSNTSKQHVSHASKQMLVEEVAELAEHSAGNHKAGDAAEPEATHKADGTQSASPTTQPFSERHGDAAVRTAGSGSRKVAPVQSLMNSMSGSLAVDTDSTEAEDTVDDGMMLPSAISNAVAAAISPRRKATEAGEIGSPHGVSFTMRMNNSAVVSPTHSAISPPNTLNQPAGPASPVSSGGKGPSFNRSAQQYRTNEDELTAAMDAQLAYKEGLALASPKNNHNGSTSLASPKGRKIGGMGGPSPAEDNSFDLNMPLLGLKATDSVHPLAATPTLQQLLSHPICVEVLKAELLTIHSVENLIFYLHAVRYRHVQSAKLRKLLAVAIHDHFIRENAPQQININTRQRDAITATVARRGDDCPAELFREAEREVLLLMETNVMKALTGTATMRLCSWVLSSMPMGAVISSERAAGLVDRERVHAKESSMMLSDVKSSMTAAKESARSSKQANS